MNKVISNNLKMSKTRKNEKNKPWFNEHLKELRTKSLYALKVIKRKGGSVFDYNN